MRKYIIIRKHPFVRLLLPLLTGILATNFLSSYLENSFKPLFTSTLFFACIFVFVHFIKKHSLLSTITLSATIFLFSLSSTMYHTYTPPVPDLKVWQGTIYDVPIKKSNSLLIPIKLAANQFDSCEIKKAHKVYLYTNIDSNNTSLYSTGQEIAFYSRLNRIKNNGNPNEFNYARHLSANKVLLQSYCTNDKIKIIKSEQGAFRFALQKTQQKTQNTFIRFLKNKQSLSIVNALVLGDKQHLNSELKQSYTNAGAIHVLAVSGLHVGIIFAFVNYLLFFMSNSLRQRVIKTCITISIIWIYATISGLSPSVCRAATMFSLLGIGKLLQRDVSYFNILALAAFVMLIVNPQLLFNVGFQLSFAAVGGIVYFQPKLNQLLNFRFKALNLLYSVFTVTISAQLITTPLTLYYFHQFPSYFWLTNLFLVYQISAALILAVALLLLSWVPVLNTAIAYLLEIVLHSTNSWVKFIDNLPYSTINNIHITALTAITLFGIILLIDLWLLRKNKTFIRYALATLVILQTGLLLGNSLKNTKDTILFYNHPKSSYLSFTQHGKNILLYNAPDAVHHNNLKYYFSTHLLKTQQHKHTQQLNIDNDLYAEGLNILKLKNGSNIALYNKHISLKTEDNALAYLFVCNSLWPPKQKLNAHVIILGNNLYYKQKKAWKAYAIKHKTQIIDLQDGAYEIEL